MSDHPAAPSDGRLVEAARSSPAALGQLYRRHYDAVFRYCVHRLFDRTAAEDVTSTVFLKVVEGLDAFRGDERGFRNWLYRIATNAVNNHLRKAGRRKRLLQAVVVDVNEPELDCSETVDDAAGRLIVVRRAMVALRPKYQTIIALRFFEHMSASQIADILGSTPATVRSQLSRALSKLRKRLAVVEGQAPGEVRTDD